MTEFFEEQREGRRPRIMVAKTGAPRVLRTAAFFDYALYVSIGCCGC
uniref:Uncharacterized protein n=1 Tax=Candidatus Kentrum sp. DK TaxID=2126562 RepID=A0A450TLG0_9GAMM|nr:MAG: hypothetical protein BECKDK2373C_GA0170839_11873 [Candidatus Kentron sp. DK]